MPNYYLTITPIDTLSTSTYSVYFDEIKPSNLMLSSIPQSTLAAGLLVYFTGSAANATSVLVKNEDPDCCCAVQSYLLPTPSPTAAPTTAAPTTAPTAAPTTAAPTTAAPTTAAPTTAAPTAQPTPQPTAAPTRYIGGIGTTGCYTTRCTNGSGGATIPCNVTFDLIYTILPGDTISVGAGSYQSGGGSYNLILDGGVYKLQVYYDNGTNPPNAGISFEIKDSGGTSQLLSTVYTLPSPGLTWGFPSC